MKNMPVLNKLIRPVINEIIRRKLVFLRKKIEKMRKTGLFEIRRKKHFNKKFKNSRF